MIYEYINEESGKVIEREQSIHDDLPKKIEVDGTEYILIVGSSVIIPQHFTSDVVNMRKRTGKKILY